MGYLYKRIVSAPEALKLEKVVDIYSLSSCVNDDFADYIQFWKHNGFWLFDSPAIMEEIAMEEGISLADQRLFYYEIFEQQFNDKKKRWESFTPSFETNVRTPDQKVLEGFDVTSFYALTSPECSPLSCNGLAATVPTNEHCLFPTFADAHNAIAEGRFDGCEPGPYRVIAVYSIPS